MAQHVEGSLSGGSGDLYWQGWLPADGADVKGVVVLVHGLHEHSGRYAHVGERLAGDGYPAYAGDHAGHGRSGGVRGNIGRMAEVVSGVHALTRFAADRHAGAPVFVLGHSMGGLIALQYVTGSPASLRGAILSAPAVDLSAASRAMRAAGRVLSVVAPRLGVMALDANLVSRDPAVVRDYETDPLNYRGKIRARTGAEMVAAAEAAPERVRSLRLPLLLLHGTADRLVPRAATTLIAERAGSPDLTVKLYDGLYHEVLNEPERDVVLSDILEWLDERRNHGAPYA